MPAKTKSGGRVHQATSEKTLTWEERLRFFELLSQSLSLHIGNGDKLCVQSNMLGDAIRLEKRFGSDSANGEAWRAYTVDGDRLLSVKKIPLGKYDKLGMFTRKQLMAGDSVWAEIAAYLICNVLVLAKVCPNLPLMYKYVWCETCHFENPKIRSGRNGRPCLLVANEMADADLKMYMHDKQKLSVWTSDLVDSFVFQTVAALYTLEKYFKMTHNDLHYGNILVHKVQPGGFWEYRIDGVNYYVPNLGYIFLLWDLGMIHVPRVIKGRPEFLTAKASPVPNESDIGRICSIMWEVFDEEGYKTLGKHPMLRKISKFEGKMTLKEIILDMLHVFRGKKPPVHQIIDSFNMDFPKAELLDAFPKELKLIMSGKT